MITKNKVYLAITIFLLLSASLIIVLIQPIYKEIQNNSQELVSKEKEVATLDAKIKNIEEFRKSYKEIGENLKKINDLPINSKAPIGFISFLEKSSLSSQCPIKISPSVVQEDKDSAWRFIIFQIEAVSSFSNFLRFFEKLESSPYLLEIRNIRVDRLTEQDLKAKQYEGASLGNIKASLSVKVFSN